MKSTVEKTKHFDIKKSIQKGTEKKLHPSKHTFKSDGKVYEWTDKLERVDIIRKGIPYDSIEVISKKLDQPVKSTLALIGMPQTTYNKKKSSHSLLDSRDSELILMISELIDYGIKVFNDEKEKFQRWLKKTNISLGGNSPENLLDTITGIDEVRYCLDRLEYGNLA